MRIFFFPLFLGFLPFCIASLAHDNPRPIERADPLPCFQSMTTLKKLLVGGIITSCFSPLTLAKEPPTYLKGIDMEEYVNTSMYFSFLEGDLSLYSLEHFLGLSQGSTWWDHEPYVMDTVCHNSTPCLFLEEKRHLASVSYHGGAKHEYIKGMLEVPVGNNGSYATCFAADTLTDPPGGNWDIITYCIDRDTHAPLHGTVIGVTGNDKVTSFLAYALNGTVTRCFIYGPCTRAHGSYPRVCLHVLDVHSESMDTFRMDYLTTYIPLVERTDLPDGAVLVNNSLRLLVTGIDEKGEKHFVLLTYENLESNLTLVRQERIALFANQTATLAASNGSMVYAGYEKSPNNDIFTFLSEIYPNETIGTSRVVSARDKHLPKVIASNATHWLLVSEMLPEGKANLHIALFLFDKKYLTLEASFFVDLGTYISVEVASYDLNKKLWAIGGNIAGTSYERLAGFIILCNNEMECLLCIVDASQYEYIYALLFSQNKEGESLLKGGGGTTSYGKQTQQYVFETELKSISYMVHGIPCAEAYSLSMIQRNDSYVFRIDQEVLINTTNVVTREMSQRQPEADETTPLFSCQATYGPSPPPSDAPSSAPSFGPTFAPSLQTLSPSQTPSKYPSLPPSMTPGLRPKRKNPKLFQTSSDSFFLWFMPIPISFIGIGICGVCRYTKRKKKVQKPRSVLIGQKTNHTVNVLTAKE